MLIVTQKKTESLKDKHYAAILRRITHGEYNPGDIITEKKLADEFNVSKSPIREALLELCKDGLLVNIPRYGYQVTFFSDETIDEMVEFRKVLECSYFSRNFDKITEEQTEELSQLLVKLSAIGLEDALQHWENNSAFHSTLFSFYNSEYAQKQLAEVLRKLGIVYIRKYWDLLHNTRIMTNQLHHSELVAFIKEKNKEAAMDLLVTDIEEFYNPEIQLQKAISPDARPSS